MDVARIERVLASLMRYLVAEFVRFPSEVERLEGRLVGRAHFIGHRLALIAERIQKFVQHNIRLKYGEPPGALGIGAYLFENVVPAQKGFWHIVRGDRMLVGGEFPALQLAYLEHANGAIDDDGDHAEREDHRECDKGAPAVEEPVVDAGRARGLEVIYHLRHGKRFRDGCRRRERLVRRAARNGYKRARHPLESELPCEVERLR